MCVKEEWRKGPSIVPEAPHVHGPFVIGVTLVDAGVALEMDAHAMTRILEILK